MVRLFSVFFVETSLMLPGNRNKGKKGDLLLDEIAKTGEKCYIYLVAACFLHADKKGKR